LLRCISCAIELARASEVPAHQEPLLPGRISTMLSVVLGNRRRAKITGTGEVIVIGLAIGVITPIGVVAFVVQL
jgi:hypothetical protein